jgi:RNA polymerase sigma factor (sigma-70 family)
VRSRGRGDTGDVDRFADALAGLYPQLVAVVTGYVRSVPVAEDVAQDALVKAWEHRHQVEVIRDPKLWVFRVAINRSRSLHRRALVELKHLRPSPTASTDPGGGVDDSLVVRAAIRKLPSRQRAAVVLRFYGDLSVAETAEVMGCATGTVKALTSQAMTSLRTRLEGADDGS